MKPVRISLLFLLLFALFNPLPVAAQTQYTVVAIGDSHVSEHSLFLRYLRRELGSQYIVRAEGRTGWTTRRWLAAGDFAARCDGADIVLVSLGGNDAALRRSWSSIYTNVKQLTGQIPSDGRTRVIYHMAIPRFYRPRLPMARDGIHLSHSGARRYAEIVAPHLRLLPVSHE